jgi:hypothetical protein
MAAAVMAYGVASAHSALLAAATAAATAAAKAAVGTLHLALAAHLHAVMSCV